MAVVRCLAGKTIDGRQTLVDREDLRLNGNDAEGSQTSTVHVAVTLRLHLGSKQIDTTSTLSFSIFRPNRNLRGISPSKLSLRPIGHQFPSLPFLLGSLPREDIHRPLLQQ